MIIKALCRYRTCKALLRNLILLRSEIGNLTREVSWSDLNIYKMILLSVLRGDCSIMVTFREIGKPSKRTWWFSLGSRDWRTEQPWYSGCYCKIKLNGFVIGLDTGRQQGDELNMTPRKIKHSSLDILHFKTY